MVALPLLLQQHAWSGAREVRPMLSPYLKSDAKELLAQSEDCSCLPKLAKPSSGSGIQRDGLHLARLDMAVLSGTYPLYH